MPLFLATEITNFSLPHIMAMLVTILLLVALFFTRKFFMRNKTADLIIRIFFAFILIGSEVIINHYWFFNKNPLVINIIPHPLCGFLLWICSIACLANSGRIMKKFFPLFCVGATLSLITCDLPGYTFLTFRGYQYFLCHSGFLLAAFYFVFTRKINKFDFKDYAWSCLILLVMGSISATLYIVNPNIFPDDFYVMGYGLGFLADIREVVGVVPFSLIYIISIAAIMLVFSTVTFFLTRKRDDVGNVPTYKNGKFLDFITYKITFNGRLAILASVVTLLFFIMAWQAKLAGIDLEGKPLPEMISNPLIIAMGYIFMSLYFIGLAVAILIEIAHQYEEQNLKSKLLCSN